MTASKNKRKKTVKSGKNINQVLQKKREAMLRKTEVYGTYNNTCGFYCLSVLSLSDYV